MRTFKSLDTKNYTCVCVCINVFIHRLCPGRRSRRANSPGARSPSSTQIVVSPIKGTGVLKETAGSKTGEKTQDLGVPEREPLIKGKKTTRASMPKGGKLRAIK